MVGSPEGTGAVMPSPMCLRIGDGRMPLTLNPPPPTPIEPVTEIVHGVPVTDPNWWNTCAYLGSLPGCIRTRNRVEELLAVDAIPHAWKVGNRLFHLKRAAQVNGLR